MAILTGTDCTTNRLGTGMESCQVIEGLPSGLILTPKGWSLNKTSGTFNKAYVQDQIRRGSFIPMVNCFDAVSETPDPTTEESQSGIMSVVRQGKPTLTFTFKDGIAGHKARYSYNSFTQYDVLLVFETGVIWCAETIDGTAIKGFSIGMLNTGGYQLNNGTNSASSVLKFQITNPQEYNQYAFPLAGLDFNPNTEIEGITDVKLVITGTEEGPEAGQSKLFFKANWIHNEQFNFSFFDRGDVYIRVDGVVKSHPAIPIPMVYNNETKQYEYIVDHEFATDEVVTVTLGFSGIAGYAFPTVQKGNKIYKGTSKGYIVPA